MTATFEETADGKTLVVMRGVFATTGERDRVARECGAVQRAEQTVGRPADWVASLR